MPRAWSGRGRQSFDKCRKVVRVGTIDGPETRQFDQAESVTQAWGEFLDDPGKPGGDQPTAAGQRLHQNQRQAFVERRQDADRRTASNLGKLGL